MLDRFFAGIAENASALAPSRATQSPRAPSWNHPQNHSDDKNLFISTKSAGGILEKVARAKQALVSQYEDGIRDHG
ncbi:hypothetical protein ABIF97_004068 [Bradyrhizobium japonicum]